MKTSAFRKLMVILLLCLLPAPSHASESNDLVASALNVQEIQRVLYCNVPLPEDVQKYLKEELPDWVPLSRSDFPNFDTTYDEWLHWTMRGDFDGNGHEDIVLLMKNGEERACFAVLRTEAGLKLELVKNELYENDTLSRQEPGETSISMADAREHEMRDFDHPSIIISGLNTCGTTLYYWENGRFKAAYRGL